MEQTPLHLASPLTQSFMALHEAFKSAREAGFTENQAIKLIVQMADQTKRGNDA